MSLISDPLYLIHISRIKFLRTDERGERIITFPPTVMSDDYVRLAAPVYPEMQYCYSPVYNNYLNNTSETYMNVTLTSSPRTTRRNYHQRAFNKSNLRPDVLARNSKLHESTTDSEDDDIEVDKQVILQEKDTEEKEPSLPTVAAAVGPISPQAVDTNTTNEHRSFADTTIHPSVDSAIDPSPRFSMEEASELSEQEPATTTSTLDYSKQAIKKPQFKSALSAMIAERATAEENPFAEYAFVSGKGEPKSISLCVYLPHSSNPYTPVNLVVRPDAITDDVIGYILYTYVEEKYKPELDVTEYDLAEWVLLIAEDDGEIEDDLPAIDRTRTIGRVQFDQFALCRATPSQAKQNDADRARMGRTKPDIEALAKKKQETSVPALPPSHTNEAVLPTIEDIDTEVSPTHINHLNTDETMALLINQQQHHEPDASTVAVPVPSSKATLTKATMPMTPLKYFRIKLMTNEEVSATTAIPVYAEMFIGDVLELVSRKRKLDPNEYMLTIADSNVIVPNDTTVESMKGITDLTLTKKGTQLSIPSNSTTHLWRSPIKRKKEEVAAPTYFSTTEGSAGVPSTSNANDVYAQYKKYTVSRKMPMFVSKRLYILAIDGDYIHLMPPEHKGMFDSVKTSSFHASAVRSCKQSKKVPTNFKVIIIKEGNFKTYDLEAESAKDANEICNRIRLLMQITKGT